jgi:hypothetical protein
MDIDQQRIQDLIDHPAESLNVEIKRWIDPREAEGQAKIVRAVLALRNRNGGHLVIGFDDKTLAPDDGNPPSDVKSPFHPDAMQALVSRYSSEPFEVGVGYGERRGQIFPIIFVPSGVQVPTVAKADLSSNGKKLIRAGAVYFRSLHANGTVSTVEARPEDWRDLLAICFDNREADFGKFFRRQLAGITPDVIKDLLLALKPAPAKPTTRELALSLLADGQQRFLTAVGERVKEEKGFDRTFLSYGARSAALTISGDIPPRVADRSFFNLIASSNPQYTGWPAWVDSRGFDDAKDHPRHRDGGWQTLIVSIGAAMIDVAEFMRIDPTGKFYHRRVFEDDLAKRTRNLDPLRILDPVLTVYRVAEVIAVGLAFARAMGCTPDKTTLAFAFHWNTLKGRQLNTWTDPMRLIIGHHTAVDDLATTCVELSLETPPSAIAPYVEQATQDLFLKFDGYSMVRGVIEDLVSRLIQRRW